MTDQLGVNPWGCRYYGFEESRTQSFTAASSGCCSTSFGARSTRTAFFAAGHRGLYKLTNDMLFDAQGSRVASARRHTTIRLKHTLVHGHDIQVFGGHPTWQDEKALELRKWEPRHSSFDRKVTFNASAFWTGDL